MSLGSHLKISKLHEEMKAIRNGGKNVTLKQHLEGKDYKELSANFPERRLEKYFLDYGIDTKKMTVEQLLEFDTDAKGNALLLSEMILSALQIGLTESDFVKDFLAASISAPGLTRVVQPYLDTSQMKAIVKKGKSVAPGANFERDKIGVGQKGVLFETFGRELEITYKTLRNIKLDTLAVFLRGTASVILIDRLLFVIDVLMNGDNATDMKGNKVDDTPATIGVGTADTLVYKDILRGSARMSKLGRGPGNISADEPFMLDILELDEYKQKTQGTANTVLTLKGNIRTPNNAYMVDEIGTDKLLLQCANLGLVEYINQGLMIETEKIISRQIEKAVVSTSLAYMNLYRDSRLIIDKTKAFVDDPFPAWMDVQRPK